MNGMPVAFSSDVHRQRTDGPVQSQLADAGVGAVVLYSLFEEQLRRGAEQNSRMARAGSESFAESLSYFPEAAGAEHGERPYLSLLERSAAAVSIPVIGSVPVTSALLFDIGVFALVVGATVLMLIAILWLIGFPVFSVFVTSFRQLNLGELVRGEIVWTGIDNYLTVLKDERFWSVALRTVVFTVAVPKGMRQRRAGRIVHVTSMGGFITLPGIAYYCGSKFALEGISESLGKEVAPFGIFVTALAPGQFRTDWAGRSMDRTARSIPDYDGVMDPIRTARQAKSGRQPGDPAKAAQAQAKASAKGAPGAASVLMVSDWLPVFVRVTASGPPVPPSAPSSSSVRSAASSSDWVALPWTRPVGARPAETTMLAGSAALIY